MEALDHLYGFNCRFGHLLVGDDQFLDHVPIACKDAVAILVMFDLTNRSTLNKSVFSLSLNKSFKNRIL